VPYRKFPNPAATIADFCDWHSEIVRDPEWRVLVLKFLYIIDTSLMFSIQEYRTGAYYDFADKRFKQVKEVFVPRGGFTPFGDIGHGSFLYAAAIGRSARLDGEYVITVRDSLHNCRIVALLTCVVRDNQFSPCEDSIALSVYTPETELPPACMPLRTGGDVRTGRVIELE
jgi:hypothetical protein